MTEFERIYTSYFNDVYLYIRRLSGDTHIAEEITSETFFKAMRSIDGFRGDCDIRIWLCQIARNCFYSYRGKTGRADSIEALGRDIPSQGMSLEERALRHDEAMGIRKVLHGMPEPYKEVFMWRVFGELSFRQIGHIFLKSENWACVTYHRARNMIRTRLEGEEYEK